MTVIYVTPEEEGSPDRQAWEACWEVVLCLPIGDALIAELSIFAEREVRSCRRKTRNREIEWITQEIEDALAFVSEQLAEHPLDVDWARIMAALDGASSGLKRARRSKAAGPAAANRNRVRRSPRRTARSPRRRPAAPLSFPAPLIDCGSKT